MAFFDRRSMIFAKRQNGFRIHACMMQYIMYTFSNHKSIGNSHPHLILCQVKGSPVSFTVVNITCRYARSKQRQTKLKEDEETHSASFGGCDRCVKC